MNRPGPVRASVVIGATAALVAACGSSGGPATPTPSGPSGPLGVVTVEAAATAVRGLCDIRDRYADDLERANGTFYDTAHDELHVIAAAAEGEDRVVSARLLEAKEKVEDDLRADTPPEFFPDDVGKLVDATLAALDVLGIDVPPCPA